MELLTPTADTAPTLADYAHELNDLVEKLSGLGQLTLEGCRRTAFAIAGEDILDNEAREVLRGMYAPLEEPSPTPKPIRILDGGLCQ